MNDRPTQFDYDEAQAARILGLSVRTLQRYRKAFRIAHYALPGGRIRYSAMQLADFAASCRVVSSHSIG